MEIPEITKLEDNVKLWPLICLMKLNAILKNVVGD